MKREYFECDNCKKKAFDDLPKDWYFIKSIIVAKGYYSELPLKRIENTDRNLFFANWNLTFCSFKCLTQYLGKYLCKSPKNPSSAY